MLNIEEIISDTEFWSNDDLLSLQDFIKDHEDKMILVDEENYPHLFDDIIKIQIDIDNDYIIPYVANDVTLRILYDAQKNNWRNKDD